MRWLFLIPLSAAVLFYGLWRSEEGGRRRAEANFYAALDTARSYRVRDSLSAVSVAAMQLELDHYKALRAADAALIGQMGLRLRRVESVAKISTESRYGFYVPRDSLVWRIRTPHLDFLSRGDSVRLVVRDTLVQVLHRVPRFKFLGIWFGTKGVRQEIVSKNPYTEVVAAEYLKIVR